MRIRRYKYRIYPDRDQQQYLANVFGANRFLWNHILDRYNQLYKATVDNPSGQVVYYSLTQASKYLTELKASNVYPWLNEVPDVTLRQTLRILDTAYFRFKKRVSGLPQFKKRSNYQSAHFPFAAGGFDLRSGKLKLAKLSKPIKVRWNRLLPSAPKTATIIKTPAGQYYVSFTCQLDGHTYPAKELTEQDILGIDLGLTSLLTASDNTKIANPRYYDKSLKQLKRLQRKLSRQVKNSNGYKKTRLRIAKLHQRIVNQRLDFLHKLTTSLVSNNLAICIEDLNTSGMAKNRHLAKSIMTAGWGMLRSMLEYKVAQSIHCNLVVAHPHFPSTRLCSHCQHKHYKSLKPGITAWKCENCGTEHDRDYNASYNLRDLAIQYAGLWIDKAGKLIKLPLTAYPVSYAPVAV